MNSLHSSAAIAFTLAATAGLSGQNNTFPATGNVGIGTTTPTAKLEIANGGSASLRVGVSNNAANTYAQVRESLAAVGYDAASHSLVGALAYNHYNDGNNPSWAGTFLSYFGPQATGSAYGVPRASSGALVFQNEVSGVIATNGMSPIYISPYGSVAASFLANGNVGIGTTSPAGRLDIRGISNINAYTAPADQADLRILSTANRSYDGGIIQLGGSWGATGYIKTAALNGNAGAMVFGTRLAPNDATMQPVMTLAGTYVGVGTTQPDRPLTVVATSLGVPAGDRRDVAVFQGWSANCDKLEVFLKRRVAGGDWQSADFLLQRKVDFTPMGFVRFAGFDTAIGTGEIDYLTIKNGGNVGIGTTNPTNKLEVAGTIRAKEVIVETTGWSDYVFAPGYQLTPLSEVEAHIAAKGTLPGIPSAAEVATQGVSVGDMQAKLLAKVEELTLHLIALEKENAALKTRVAALETQ